MDRENEKENGKLVDIGRENDRDETVWATMVSSLYKLRLWLCISNKVFITITRGFHFAR